MKFRYEHRFVGGPYDDVLHYLTEEYAFEPSTLPNVQTCKLIEEIITEDKKSWKNEWCAHGQIPKVIQHILKPKMLTWIEATTLDRRARSFTSTITPFYFKNVFRCESRGYFNKLSGNEFLRVTEGVLEIRIPVFGGLIEEAILAHLKQNFDTEYKLTYKTVKEKFGN
jgi:hypothetical protein